MTNNNDDALKLMQLEQSLEQFSMQKKQFQTQLAEVEAALAATEKSGDAYRIIGNLMVKQSGAQVRKDLDERKETLLVRIKAIEKQEDRLRSQAKDARETAMQRVKKKK